MTRRALEERTSNGRFLRNVTSVWQRLAPAPNDLLRDASYRRLWTSVLISSFGAQVSLLALPLTAALLLGASPTQLGILIAMKSAPFIVLSLPAGVWLDRVHKLSVYVFGELTLAFAAASVPLALWLGWLSIHWLYVVGFTTGMVNATAGSAGQVVLTQTVPRGRLVEAHAKNALATSAAETAGPGAAGMLIKLAGAPLALLFDAAVLLTSALILRGMAVKETPNTTHRPFWASMLEGLTFVRQHKLLSAMAGCIATWNMCAEAAVAVQILFATQKLHMGAGGIGLSYMALGIGTVGASAMAHGLARKMGPGPLMTFGFALGGAGWLLLAVAPLNGYGIGAFVTMLVAYGAGASFVFINHLALRQSVTPPSMLGRMTSTMRWLVLLPAPAGAILGGWLGEHFGLRASLIFAGITALVLALCARQIRVIRDVRTLPTFTSEAVAPFSSEGN